MKRLLLLLALLLPLGVLGQPILRNSYSTNAVGKLPGFLPTTTSPLYPLLIDNANGGSGTDQTIQFSTTLKLTSTNTTLAGLLSLNGRTNVISISATNTLLLDGVPIVSGGSTVTNTIINATTINVSTQIFNTAKGGHLTVSNSFTILTNGVFTLSNLPWPSVLLVGPDGAATNATLSGLSLAGTTLTATGGGGGGSTNYRSTVINLTMTTTNVDAGQIDWLKTNVCYRLTLTTNAFFGDGVCINVPDTNSFQWLQLNLVQDATGTRLVTFTNSIYAGVNGTFAITTNANAWDSLALLNSPQTNGNVAVLPSNNLRR